MDRNSVQNGGIIENYSYVYNSVSDVLDEDVFIGQYGYKMFNVKPEGVERRHWDVLLDDFYQENSRMEQTLNGQKYDKKGQIFELMHDLRPYSKIDSDSDKYDLLTNYESYQVDSEIINFVLPQFF